MLRRLVVTDFSGQSLGNNSKGQAINVSPLKLGSTGCPETSLT
jgi:hypothetical protein